MSAYLLLLLFQKLLPLSVIHDAFCAQVFKKQSRQVEPFSAKAEKLGLRFQDRELAVL